MVEGKDINLAPAPLPLSRTKSWKEYDGNDEIPMILSEGLLPVKFQGAEFQVRPSVCTKMSKVTA